MKLSTNWHEDILCLFGVNIEKLEEFVGGEGELPIHFLNTRKFDGPKWVNLPGAYIRQKLDDINEMFLEEGHALLKWIKQKHTHAEIGIFLFLTFNKFFIVQKRRKILRDHLKIQKAVQDGYDYLDKNSQLCNEFNCVCCRLYKNCPLE